jgi:hypothetical protein
MPIQRRSGDTAARGVCAVGDSLRVGYVADTSEFVESLVVSVKANAGAPTAAQQLGVARVVVTVGKPRDGASIVVSSGGQDAYMLEGQVISDSHVPMAYQATPAIIPLAHRMESGDSITIEVTQGIDTTGAAFDVDAGVSINRKPSAYGVKG